MDLGSLPHQENELGPITLSRPSSPVAFVQEDSLMETGECKQDNNGTALADAMLDRSHGVSEQQGTVEMTDGNPTAAAGPEVCPLQQAAVSDTSPAEMDLSGTVSGTGCEGEAAGHSAVLSPIGPACCECSLMSGCDDPNHPCPCRHAEIPRLCTRTCTPGANSKCLNVYQKMLVPAGRRRNGSGHGASSIAATVVRESMSPTRRKSTGRKPRSSPAKGKRQSGREDQTTAENTADLDGADDEEKTQVASGPDVRRHVLNNPSAMNYNGSWTPMGLRGQGPKRVEAAGQIADEIAEVETASVVLGELSRNVTDSHPARIDAVQLRTIERLVPVYRQLKVQYDKRIAVDADRIAKLTDHIQRLEKGREEMQAKLDRSIVKAAELRFNPSVNVSTQQPVVTMLPLPTDMTASGQALQMFRSPGPVAVSTLPVIKPKPNVIAPDRCLVMRLRVGCATPTAALRQVQKILITAGLTPSNVDSDMHPIDATQINGSATSTQNWKIVFTNSEYAKFILERWTKSPSCTGPDITLIRVWHNGAGHEHNVVTVAAGREDAEHKTESHHRKSSRMDSRGASKGTGHDYDHRQTAEAFMKSKRKESRTTGQDMTRIRADESDHRDSRREAKRDKRTKLNARSGSAPKKDVSTLGLQSSSQSPGRLKLQYAMTSPAPSFPIQMVTAQPYHGVGQPSMLTAGPSMLMPQQSYPAQMAPLQLSYGPNSFALGQVQHPPIAVGPSFMPFHPQGTSVASAYFM